MRKAQVVVAQTRSRSEQLRTMPYAEYLLTPEWQAKRKEALRFAQYRCQLCYADARLNVHHRTYERRGCELPSDLITLCEECHSKFHQKVVTPDDLLDPSQEEPTSDKASPWLVGSGTAVVLVPILDFAMQWGIFGVILGGGAAAAIGYTWGPQIMRWMRRRGVATPTLPALPQVNRETLERLTTPTYLLPKRTKEPVVVDSQRDESFLNEPNDDMPTLPQRKRSSEPQDEIQKLEQLLDQVLKDFQIHARVLPVTAVGPKVIQLGIQPTGIPATEKGKVIRDEQGNIVYKRTKIADITRRELDIKLALGAKTIRIVAPVPGERYVGIEIPNPVEQTVTLADVLQDPVYQEACASSKLIVALGQDLYGNVRFCDIEQAPHLLIGGTTGSGKSVLINVLIASLISNATPHDVRMLMVDPKRVDLTPYNGIAHLMQPVITDMEQVLPMLKRAIAEMDRRSKIFEKLGVPKLAEYRQLRVERPDLENLPAWVIVIDEFADLMMTTPKKGAKEEENNTVETCICRLAQKARAIGIHLIVATQKPVVEIITGTIKSNLPTSIALKTKSAVDSRVILDQVGAERLLGNGDLLYLPSDSEHPIRIQGAYMTRKEIHAIADRWRRAEPNTSEAPELQRQAERAADRSTSPKNLDMETITTWYQAGKIGQTQFLILHKEVTAQKGKMVEAPPVSEQILERIREMKANRYKDEDIIVLIGLRGKPALYQQALAWLAEHCDEKGLNTEDLPEYDEDFSTNGAPNNLVLLRRNVRATNAQNSPQFVDSSPATENGDAATYAQNTSSNQPVEGAQAQKPTVKQYRLDAKQIAMFCALYPVHIASKDDALREIGANTSYRAHANEIIEEYKLLEKKRG